MIPIIFNCCRNRNSGVRYLEKWEKAAEASVSIFSHQLHILYNSCNYGAVYD